MIESKEHIENDDSIPKIIYSALHLMGIEFWIVAMGPFFIGWVIASNQFFPDIKGYLGLATIGPLLGGFTFLLNDYSDMQTDSKHRRKKSSPLLKGIVEPKTVLYTAYSFAVIGILLALILSLEFAFIVVLIIILSLLYSHPSFKFKSIGGLDITINMIGIGLLCPLGGWVVAGRVIVDFPIFYLASIFLIIGGLYAPTTVADYEVDKAHNVKTLAVRLGQKSTIILAFILLTAGIGSVIIEGWFDYVMTRPILYKTWPFLVIQPVLYLIFLRKTTYSNILAALVSVAISQIVGILLFLLYYTGELQI
jgi:geranylgeranylglycerol-phosphate geranylgeranyltransferase